MVGWTDCWMVNGQWCVGMLEEWNVGDVNIEADFG